MLVFRTSFSINDLCIHSKVRCCRSVMRYFWVRNLSSIYWRICIMIALHPSLHLFLNHILNRNWLMVSNRLAIKVYTSKDWLRLLSYQRIRGVSPARTHFITVCWPRVSPLPVNTSTWGRRCALFKLLIAHLHILILLQLFRNVETYWRR